MVGSDKVKNVFKKKFPSLSSLGSDGNTSFLRAARAGHLDKVLEQLRNNVDINTSNANGLNALHLASKDGHVHVVTELLKRGANVDSATKKGNTALHIASLAGQEEVVKLLVEHGASVNVQSQNGFTPLYMAAQENHDNVVKYLLANGANQSLATEDGFTPLAVAMQQGHDKVVAVLLENDTRGKVRLPALHIAAKKDDCKAAALLLQNEHNPDVTSKSGFTPLHIASHYGNEGIANLLLNKGADVNYSAKHNITPLHVAAKWGKSNMVSLLLEKGANIESRTRDGLTPLHCAARSGHEQVVDMLLERGAPISSKTKNGLAPLHMASQGDHVDAARILLYHRAPVDEVTVDYLTALHVAAHCGHARVAKLLLDRKADPNARALNGFTPLHIACKKNRIKVVELLLKHGASIEATTESGLTPLHVASFMGCMNIVIYLLQNEASPDVPTVRGETPLHLAARANQTDIIRILLRNGAQVDARAREQQTPLHIAARLGNVDIVMLLLQHGAAVDCTTKDLYSALHIAAKEGQDEVAAVLLENGASPTATTKKGFTPLHLAAKYGNMKVARLLLQRDAPVDAQGKNGVTPLHVASHYDHQNVALLLLDKGASPHATAKNGHTPLHIAAKKNQMDIATTLLEYGAKASAESKAGFTPLHLSAQEGHVDMSSLLIDHQADTNHKAKNGLTPLHLCAQEDRVPVASVLVKNGAEVEATTKAGYTPLHVACHFGQLAMVKFLVGEGSKVGASTAVGYTPLHQAAQQGHCAVVNTLLEHGAPANATTNQGQTAMSIAQKLGYISVVETLKGVTEPTTITTSGTDEKYKVVSPETMQETFMSDSEDEGGEDTLLSEQPYRYLTVDEMKSLGDDSLPIDVRQDERMDSNRECMTVPPTAVDDTISPQHMKEAYSQFTTPDNIDIARHPLHVGKLQWRNFLVSFLVDARGGAMRGCRHSGVRVIVPPRRASMPMRVTCRYLKRDKLSHPPPLMEGEALASRILELGPVGAKFLGPVMIEVPHFGSLRGKEREIVILRSDNGETWREHTVDCSDEAVQDVLNHSFDKEADLAQLDETGRTTRILTTDFPHYFAVVTRVRQEVHAIGPEGGMVSSSVVPQVQAVFPQGALTKKIKVGLQAQPISAELAAKMLGNRVAVSPIVTVEPRRRKFHKPITLTIPKPQAASKGMINNYSGDAPTLRLLCSITGGTTRAQWEDVTGSTPFTFVNDCVSFTTTVSARFWLMDCRNVGDATKMATELYREAIHVPFMAKFVVFAKRVDPLEARLRIFCMTDDKEDKTLEHQEHFTEVAKSRDVEVLEGKTQYVEFAGNLVPVTKSGEQLQLGFRAFRENRLPFTVRVKDPHADCVGRTLFMREARLPKGEPPQQPICVLNIVLPEEIIPEAILPEHELHKYSFIQDSSGLESYQRVDLRLSDISNLLGGDWVRLADELGVTPSDINRLKSEHPQSVAQQGLAMLRLWVSQAGNKAQASTLESALSRLGRDDIVQQCVFNVDPSSLQLLKDESRDASFRRNIPYSDKDIMKDSESVEDLSKTPLRKSGDREKDDREERKYEAEEKEVEEVKKSVVERRKEIEKRLSVEKQLEQKSETIIENISVSKKEEHLSEKEIAEEKIVSSPEGEEPSELSFEQKRLSFEQGKRVIEMKPDKTTMKEVKERAEINERLLAEERKAAEAALQSSMVDNTSIPFQEKRKSFEQGVKEEKAKGDKAKDDKVKDDKAKEKKKEDQRRDSALFEGVSQGLVRIDAAFTAAPQVQDLLSPKVSKTPPPSPAEFKDIPENITGTVAWTEEPAPKPVQSQDWADKGIPDSTVDISKKGASRLNAKEDSQVIPEFNSNISVTSKQPQISKVIDIDTKVAINDEKNSKYQFTMSVPDKQTYSETLNSLSSFLEAEKLYNDQTFKVKPDRLTSLADSEVTSSDETEESQSRSEVEPSSDKSFVGKMSKKIFGVFKKDDKERSEKKKKRKVKQAEEGVRKDEVIQESKPVHIKPDLIGSVRTNLKEATDKAALVVENIIEDNGVLSNQTEIKIKTVKDIEKLRNEPKHDSDSKGKIYLHDVDQFEELKTKVNEHSKTIVDPASGIELLSKKKSKTSDVIHVVEGKLGETPHDSIMNSTQATKPNTFEAMSSVAETILPQNENDQFKSSDKITLNYKYLDVSEPTIVPHSISVENDSEKTTKDDKNKLAATINSFQKTSSELIEENKRLGDECKERLEEEKGEIVNLTMTSSESSGQLLSSVVNDLERQSTYLVEEVKTTISDSIIKVNDCAPLKEIAEETLFSVTKTVPESTDKVYDDTISKTSNIDKTFDDKSKQTKEKGKSFFSGLFSRANEKANDAKHSVVEKTATLSESATDVVGSEINNIGVVLNDGKNKTSDVVTIISEGVDQVKENAKSSVDRVADKVVLGIENKNSKITDMVSLDSRRENSDVASETVTPNVDLTSTTKEKAKSFFGSFFSKSDTSHDIDKEKSNSTDDEKLSDPNKSVCMETEVVAPQATTETTKINSTHEEINVKEPTKTNSELIKVPETPVGSNTQHSNQTTIDSILDKSNEEVSSRNIKNQIKSKQFEIETKMVSFAENLMKPSGDFPKVDNSKIPIAIQVLDDGSRTTLDHVNSVVGTVVHKTEQVMDSVQNEIVDAAPTVVKQTKLAETFVEHSKDVVIKKEHVVDQTSKDIVEGIFEASGRVKSISDNIFSETEVEVQSGKLSLGAENPSSCELTYDPTKHNIDTSISPSRPTSDETISKLMDSSGERLSSEDVVKEIKVKVESSSTTITGPAKASKDKTVTFLENYNVDKCVDGKKSSIIDDVNDLKDTLKGVTDKTITITSEFAKQSEGFAVKGKDIVDGSAQEAKDIIEEKPSHVHETFITGVENTANTIESNSTDIVEDFINRGKKTEDHVEQIIGSKLEELHKIGRHCVDTTATNTLSGMTGNDKTVDAFEEKVSLIAGDVSVQPVKTTVVTNEKIGHHVYEPSVKATYNASVTDEMIPQGGSDILCTSKTNILEASNNETNLIDSSINLSIVVPELSGSQTKDLKLSPQPKSESLKSNDDKLNNILIDMLIEQECMKGSPTGTPSKEPLPNLMFDAGTSEKHDTEVSEKESSITSSPRFKSVSSFGNVESLIQESELNKHFEPDVGDHSSYVTTPTMQRKKRAIGGSQRLSREERPALRDISHIIDYSSSEEDESHQYIVTEPSERFSEKSATFQVESEDEAYLKVSESSSEPDLEVTEITPSPEPTSKKQSTVEESEKSTDRTKSKIESDKNAKKVERRFERMASETLEADPTVKFTTDRDFQRMVSQLSNDEVDACLSQWDKGGLTPSEELDSTNETIEGDLDPEVEALPEAHVESTNPFFSPTSQWVDFEHDIINAPSSIFWAYDTTPTSVRIQPNELDIPIKPVPVKGESAGEESKKSPGPSSTREGEEALLDLAAGLQDTKGASSGQSGTK